MLQKEIKYLGHIVSKEGVATDPEKIETVQRWGTPSHLKELLAFLGMLGYYRQYVVGFATITRPLTRLTSKDEPWRWTQEEQTTFEQLKERLVTAPILGYPKPKGEYTLDTDANATGIGAVLSQLQKGKE